MANKQRDGAKERFWRDVLERRAASGMSVRAFCRREKLTESAFYAWRRTIGERDGKRGRSTQTPPAFLPAMMTSEPRRETAIAIDLAGGRVLRLPESMSAERLAELVQALEARAAR
jgi:hypothetical protein